MPGRDAFRCCDALQSPLLNDPRVISRFRFRGRLGAPLAGVLQLSGGSILSQLLAFATSLLVARLYTPEDLGGLAVVMAWALLAAPFVTLGLQVMIVPAKTDADAVRLAQMALSSTLVGVVVSAVLLSLIPTPSSHISGSKWLLVVVVPLMLMALGSFAVLSQLGLRQRLYGSIARRGVAQNATIGIVQVGGFLVQKSSLWLVFGELVGRSVGALSLAPQALRFFRAHAGSLPPWLDVLRRYKDAVRYFLPAMACEVATVQLTVLLIARWYGAAEAGFLGLANRVLTVPAALVGAAVAQVLATELARSRDSGRLSQSLPRLRHLALGLTLLGSLFATLVFVLGPWAFSVAFGDQWRDAGELARYLSFPIVVAIVWSPFSVVFATFYRLRTFVIISILRLGSAVWAGVVLHSVGCGWIATAVGMSVAIAAVEIVGLRFAWRLVAHEAAVEAKPESVDG